MKKITLLLSVAFVTSCAHLFIGIVATQHSSIRFMVRDRILVESESVRSSPDLREQFIHAEELQQCSLKIQEEYKETIRDARNAIAAARRGNLLLTGVCGCLLLGIGFSVVVRRFQRRSNVSLGGDFGTRAGRGFLIASRLTLEAEE